MLQDGSNSDRVSHPFINRIELELASTSPSTFITTQTKTLFQVSFYSTCLQCEIFNGFLSSFQRYLLIIIRQQATTTFEKMPTSLRKKLFLFVFCLASIAQGMYSTYFVSILTIIERIYQIQSKTAGAILSATEIGQILGSLFIAYYGGRGNKPKWMSVCMTLSAIAALISISPHFITTNYAEFKVDRQIVTAASVNSPLVQMQPLPVNLIIAIFCTCLLVIGFGSTAITTLGIPLIDDIISKEESPLYLGLTIALRIFGPALGFILGSFCVKMDSGSSDTTGIESGWWIGLVIISVPLLILAIPIYFLSRNITINDGEEEDYGNITYQAAEDLDKITVDQDTIDQWKATNVCLVVNYLGPSGSTSFGKDELAHSQTFAPSLSARASTPSYTEGGKKQKPAQDKPTISDLSSSLSRLLRNRLLTLRMLSGVLHILPIAGFYTFLPKYLMEQFMVTSSSASVISGLAGILFVGLGAFIGGTIIRVFNVNSKMMTRWIAASALLFSIGMIILMNLRCDQNQGSPSCDSIVWYVILFSIFTLIHSSCEVGSMMFNLRCVNPDDRTLALGLITFSSSLLGTIPCSIIYGSIVDSTCVHWDRYTFAPDLSGSHNRGACKAYDKDLFRYNLHGLTAAVMALAFVVDCFISRRSSAVNFYDCDDNESEMDIRS